MNIFRAGLYILSWIPLFIINFVLLLIGIPIVGFYAYWPQSEWPSWTWLWQNDEDQGEPNWYELRFPDGAPWLFIPVFDLKWELRLGENMGGFDPAMVLTTLRWRNSKDRVLARYSAYARRFQYMAFRNPVNNHRFIFKDRTVYKTSGDPEAFDHGGRSLEKAGIRLSAGWRWSGPFAGYKRTWLNKTPGKYSEFYTGWKLGSPVPGLGFTLQTRFNRPYIKVDYA